MLKLLIKSKRSTNNMLLELIRSKLIISLSLIQYTTEKFKLNFSNLYY